MAELTFNELMTAHMDAIRAKANVTGKLSITEATAVIESIVINPPSGGADVSGVTATASDVLNTVTFVDSTGTLKPGLIATVEPSVTDNVFSVGKGYVSEATVLTVPLATEPSVAANVVTIHKGYNSEQKTIVIQEAGELTVSGNVITVPVGYITTERTAVVPEMTIINDGTKVTVPVGYNNVEQEFQIGGGGADVSGVTATVNDVLASKKFVDSTGTLQSGNIQTVTLTKNGNTVSVQKGYVAEPASITVEAGGGSAGGADLYRCVSYDDGSIIPAHNNIVITGSTAEVNGTYIRKDATSHNKYASWVKGNIEICYNDIDKCWIVNKPADNPAGAKTGVLYYADATGLSTSTGVPADPYTWSAVMSDTQRLTKPLTNTMANSYYTLNDNKYMGVYIQLYMEAGVEYQVGVYYPDYHYYGVSLNLYDPKRMYTEYIRDISGTTSFTIGDIEFERFVKYRVDTTGVYLLYVHCTSSGIAMPTVMLGFDKDMNLPTAPAESPYAVTSWVAVKGSGTPTVKAVNVPERAATGVKVWSGTKLNQDTDYTWSDGDATRTDLTVVGFEPTVGRVYSADTTVEVAQVYSVKPPTVDSTEMMVCLAHFDNDYRLQSDATESCLLSLSGGALLNTITKFGKGSFGGQMNHGVYGDYSGGMSVFGAPTMDAFTIEWWQRNASGLPFGGPCLYTYDYDNYEVRQELSLENILPGSPVYKADEWFHRALVREKGSTLVTEYVAGIPVATHTWEGTLGGDFTFGIGSSSYSADSGHKCCDEVAVFSYARYKGRFTPNDAPLPNIVSGLNKDTEEREVAVEGLKAVPIANKRSYALVDQTATGTSRVWITADGKWRICFNSDMDGEWIITDKEPGMDYNYNTIARMNYDWETEDVYDDGFDPITHTGWVDAVTGDPIKLIRLKDPTPDDEGNTTSRPLKFYLTGAGMEYVNGLYVFDSSPNAIRFPVANGTMTGTGYIGGKGNYCIHHAYSTSLITYNTVYLAPLNNPWNLLYSCPTKDLYNEGTQWRCLNGTAPAPVISFTKPLN